MSEYSGGVNNGIAQNVQNAECKDLCVEYVVRQDAPEKCMANYYLVYVCISRLITESKSKQIYEARACGVG